ncbi:unnamed protein product [Brassica rapa subsp. narinosa]
MFGRLCQIKWHSHRATVHKLIAVKSASGQTTVGIDPQLCHSVETLRKSQAYQNANASPFKSFSEIKAGLSNTGGNSFNTFSEDMRSGLSPNAPPTVKNPMRSRFPNTNLPDQLNQEGLPSTAGSVYRKTWTLLEEDEGRRASWLFSHFHRPNLEANADIIHIKLLRNNTFVTVTDSKGNFDGKHRTQIETCRPPALNPLQRSRAVDVSVTELISTLDDFPESCQRGNKRKSSL